MPAVPDRDGRDLDLGRAAVLAAQRGGEEAHGAALAHVRDQEVQVHAGLPHPAVERLAAGLLLAHELRRVEEGGVGGQHDAVVIGHDEAVRRALHDFQQLGLHVRHRRRRRGREAHEEQGGAVLAEQRRLDEHLGAGRREPRPDLVRPHPGPDRAEVRLDRPDALDAEQLRQQVADEFVAGRAQQARGRRVRLGDPLLGRVDDQHGLG